MIELTIKEAVGLFCGECCGSDWEEVKSCVADGKDGRIKCFLYDLRPTKRQDKHKSIFFEEDGSRKKNTLFWVRQRKPKTKAQKEAASKTMKKVWKKKS